MCSAAVAISGPTIVVFSDLATGARISYVSAKDGVGIVTMSSVLPLRDTAGIIVQFLLDEILPRSPPVDGGGGDAPTREAKLEGIRLVKGAIVVSETFERELDLVHDPDDTPERAFAKRAIVAQRYLPMAFPEAMYS